ncbi:MAG: hypothetical protein HZC41_20840 [Chloroflexi bacterium]|nr:hypothetical protein [Chloroflexota bacterium]
MANLTISEGLFERLQELARRRNRAVEDIAETMLENSLTIVEQTAPVVEADNIPNPFLMLAELAEKSGWSSGRDDVSENFDEIVGDIIAEEFLKRQAEDNGNA